MGNTKPTTMVRKNILLLISAISIFTSCSTNNVVQKEVHDIIYSNDYTFVYMGTHWCQASINNFFNNYSRINEYKDKMGVLIIFFDSNDIIASNKEIMKYSPILLTSKGPLLDKICMNNICNNVLKNHDFMFKSPIYFLCNRDGIILESNSIMDIEKLLNE
ncbi:MAG: hypothetical protein IJZ87_07615 [Bacteroidales bacterium]|nr:hypothetical protein [Bacteroidales bacterium]